MQKFQAYSALAALTAEPQPGPLRRPGALGVRLLLSRETAALPDPRLLTNSFLPSSTARVYGGIPGGRVYSVQYSPDGSLLAAAEQRSIVAIFDPSDRSPRPIAAFMPHAQWAVTELAWVGRSALIYSTLDSELHLVKVPAERETQPLEQAALSLGPPRGTWGFRVYSFAVAPGDAELAIATSDGNLVLFSLETSKTVDSFPAHTEDINTVCYLSGVGSGSDVICSGSDDGLVQLSDRRSARKVAGVLPGHQAGITSLSSRGDGVYLCSNGKDQCVKVWDVRKALSAASWGWSRGSASSRGSGLAPNPLPYSFDYRGQTPSPAMYFRTHAAGDASVATLRGGSVLSTLIRVQWSPLASTGGRFIAAGGADGAVCLWDLAAANAGEPHTVLRPHGGALVRDVSWSPDGTALATGGFDGCVAVSRFAGGARRDRRAARALSLRERLGFFSGLLGEQGGGGEGASGSTTGAARLLLNRVAAAHKAVDEMQLRIEGHAGAAGAAQGGGELEEEGKEGEEEEEEEEEEEDGDGDGGDDDDEDGDDDEDEEEEEEEEDDDDEEEGDDDGEGDEDGEVDLEQLLELITRARGGGSGGGM